MGHVCVYTYRHVYIFKVLSDNNSDSLACRYFTFDACGRRVLMHMGRAHTQRAHDCSRLGSVARASARPPAHALTHSRTHSLTHSPAHSLARSLAHHERAQ